MYSEITANKRKTWVIFVLFVALVTGLSWILAQFLDQPLLTPYVLVGSLAYILITYYSASKLSLALNSAREIQKRDAPRLYRIVENLAITEGLPTPKVFIMHDKAPNAFATGRDPNHAAVCVTSGLLDIMNDQELQGVLAHELGHIKNYDIRVSMFAFAMVAAISLLADIMFRASWFSDSEDNKLFFIVGLLAALLAPLAAMLIQLAVSRQREYLADATGALATRYPEGLASALGKIKQYGSTIKQQNTSTAHLFFANPLKKGSISGLFSTHPPIDERIKRLQTMNTHQ